MALVLVVVPLRLQQFTSFFLLVLEATPQVSILLVQEQLGLLPPLIVEFVSISIYHTLLRAILAM